MGLSPFEAPATFSMMSYTELAHGVWYPKGGMYRIVEALVDLATEAGVEFVYNAPVERIDVNGIKARNVVLADGQQLNADALLANADLPPRPIRIYCRMISGLTGWSANAIHVRQSASSGESIRPMTT